MHVALIANSQCLDDELTQFHYLTIGLLDEGVRAAQVVPDQLPLDDSNVFGERFTWKESRWRFIEHRRLRLLAPSLEKTGVDLLHAFDGDLWEPTLDLGDELNIPVLLELSDVEELPLIDDLLYVETPMRVIIAASTQPLAEAARKRVQNHVTVEYIHPGAPTINKEHVGSADPNALCIVITGPGRAGPEYDALFAAMQSVIQVHEQLQFFLSTRGKHEHELWQAAQRFGLLANLSMVPRRLGHDELLLGADALIQPHAIGRSRSLPLHAMAHGVPVLAMQDPWVDYLVDDQTAWLVDRSSTSAWDEQLNRLIERKSEAAALGQRAKQFVATHHKLSDHVRGTLDAYQQLAAEAIQFPKAE